jgi:predicted phosphodiesterase
MPYPILFAGDPHGVFEPILRACAEHPPGCLILLGDCDLDRAPLRAVLAPVFAAGWRVHWIMGNHDADTEARFDNLAGDYPEGDIGNRVVEVRGVRFAGLGGVFKPRVWSPATSSEKAETDPPLFETRAAFFDALRPGEPWRGGLPLWHRDTIFPEDFSILAAQRFDVLVTHEAPGSHKHGVPAIGALAEAAGARLIVHGHHHASSEGTLPSGVRVRGLRVAEIWELPEGQF